MHHLSSRYIPCDGRLTASAYFDPRSPHRERHLTRTIEAGISYISIHAPRRGSDLRGAVPFHPDGYFNPRSPYEERPIPSSPRSVRSYFNPRSPHGERHAEILMLQRLLLFQSTLPAWGATERARTSIERREFQSTLPAWGATNGMVVDFKHISISIHAPRMGSDRA